MPPALVRLVPYSGSYTLDNTYDTIISIDFFFMYTLQHYFKPGIGGTQETQSLTDIHS